jgi:hypothetical protein
MKKQEIKKSEYRKLMQNAGFKVSFKTIGFSDLLRKSSETQIIKNEKGQEMPSIFCGEEHLNQWKKAIELKNTFQPV